MLGGNGFVIDIIYFQMWNEQRGHSFCTRKYPLASLECVLYVLARSNALHILYAVFWMIPYWMQTNAMNAILVGMCLWLRRLNRTF